MNYSYCIEITFFNDFSFSRPWTNRKKQQTTTTWSPVAYPKISVRDSTRLQWNCNSQISWHDANKPLCHKISTSFHFQFLEHRFFGSRTSALLTRLLLLPFLLLVLQNYFYAIWFASSTHPANALISSLLAFSISLSLSRACFCSHSFASHRCYNPSTNLYAVTPKRQYIKMLYFFGGAFARFNVFCLCVCVCVQCHSSIISTSPKNENLKQTNK